MKYRILFLFLCPILLHAQRTDGVLNDIEPKMVYVAGGTFTMGCTSEQSDCDDDETPTHRVSLSSYYIGKYEVTNAEFCVFLNDKGNQTEGGVEWLDIGSYHVLIEKRNGRYSPKSGYANHPVIEVSWYGARAYAKWLSQVSKKAYRLPTEAEWEYAARGGNKSKGYKYAGSNSAGNVAWYDDNSGGKTHSVGGKAPNELGIYDMSGNVYEWCSDWYDSDYYDNSPSNNPKGGSSGDYRVLRGGSWSLNARYLRVSNRIRLIPYNRVNVVGFRLVRQ